MLERFGCVAGNLVCSVTPRGQVSPCALLGPEFDSGDLATQGLHALWSQGAGFTRLRALEGNSDCWSCKHYDSCGGGCRARALAAGRGLDDPDPWCHYEPREGA
ncbi:MAG: SPASM domain-containing protein [Planctomycetota bacterium]